MWRQNLGIDVHLQRMEARAHRAFFGSLGDRAIHYDLYLWLWGSDYEDPYNWFNLLWQSDQDFFRIRWQNAEYDDLVRRAAREPDQARRTRMYEQAERILMDEMPVLPLYHGANTVLVKPSVQDLAFGRVASTRFLQDVSIARQ
jgi:oligopeptide transport system substrate-binding protein